MSGPGRKDQGEPDLGLCDACLEPCEYETWDDAMVDGWVSHVMHNGGLSVLVCDLCAKDVEP